MNNVSFINQIKGIKNTLWQQMKNLFEISIPNVAEKNILILVEEKKNLIQIFCYMT
jgi:hypothetical protein